MRSSEQHDRQHDEYLRQAYGPTRIEQRETDASYSRFLAGLVKSARGGDAFSAAEYALNTGLAVPTVKEQQEARTQRRVDEQREQREAAYWKTRLAHSAAGAAQGEDLTQRERSTQSVKQKRSLTL